MTETHRTQFEKLKNALELGIIDQETFDIAFAAVNAQNQALIGLIGPYGAAHPALEASPKPSACSHTA